MDRLTRKDLKTDTVAEGLGHTVEYLAGHQKQLRLYVGLGVAVIVAIAGWWIYSSRQATARSQALADAMKVYEATVGETPQPPAKNFPTALEKETAVTEAFTKLADAYPSSLEGSIARLYLAGMKVDKGELEPAIQLHQVTIDKGPDEYASVAKQALAEVYASQGKIDEAEKLLREIIDDPTAFVSAEQATLTLGRILAKDKPEEARKLLEPLREARTAVSRSAVEALAKLPVQQTPVPTPAPQN